MITHYKSGFKLKWNFFKNLSTLKIERHRIVKSRALNKIFCSQFSIICRISPRATYPALTVLIHVFTSLLGRYAPPKLSKSFCPNTLVIFLRCSRAFGMHILFGHTCLKLTAFPTSTLLVLNIARLQSFLFSLLRASEFSMEQ